MEEDWGSFWHGSPEMRAKRKGRAQQVVCCRITGKAGELDLEARRER